MTINSAQNNHNYSVLFFSDVPISVIKPRKKSAMFVDWKLPAVRTSSWLGPLSAVSATSDELLESVSHFVVLSSRKIHWLVTRASEKHRSPH